MTATRTTPAFSLLHATYRAGLAAIDVRDEWLQRATDRDDVEHIFASDEDDAISREVPDIHAGVRGPSLGHDVITAVRNWNAAAARSVGDVLVVIADDLRPPPQWDARLRSSMRDLDPRRAPFVIKVRDSDDHSEHLLRHPVVSRNYYERYGLFDPIYQGIGADNEFTLLAHKRSLVIDCRTIALEHRHPEGPVDEGERTDSQAKMLTDLRGKALWDQRWPPYRRHVVRRYLHPRPGQQQISIGERVWRRSIASLGYASLLVPASARQRVHDLRERNH